MDVRRRLLDIEAVWLIVCGVLAMVVPDAFARFGFDGVDPRAVRVIVPSLGALTVCVALIQGGIRQLGDTDALRIVLWARLVSDVLVTVIGLRGGDVFVGPAALVIEITAAIALVFSMVRISLLRSLSRDEPGPPSG